MCHVAGPQRETGQELQSEAEGEVPAPPADQTHRSSPTSTQEHLPPAKRAEDYERGSPEKVCIQVYFSFVFGTGIELANLSIGMA